MAIYNGFFSVDTFFLMSGTLACYGLLKVLDKSGGKLNIPMFYLHRYIRFDYMVYCDINFTST